jgi:hypothetical protein
MPYPTRSLDLSHLIRNGGADNHIQNEQHTRHTGDRSLVGTTFRPGQLSVIRRCLPGLFLFSHRLIARHQYASPLRPLPAAPASLPACRTRTQKGSGRAGAGRADPHRATIAVARAVPPNGTNDCYEDASAFFCCRSARRRRRRVCLTAPLWGFCVTWRLPVTVRGPGEARLRLPMTDRPRVPSPSFGCSAIPIHGAIFSSARARRSGIDGIYSRNNSTSLSRFWLPRRSAM